MRLPFYGALLTMSAHDKKYEAGRYDVAGTTLVVSRGVGFEPGLPRVRFLCRPELVRVELVGIGAPAATDGSVGDERRVAVLRRLRGRAGEREDEPRALAVPRDGDALELGVRKRDGVARRRGRCPRRR